LIDLFMYVAFCFMRPAFYAVTVDKLFGEIV